MNNKEVRSMIDMIRDADNKELVIVSLILLPIPLGAWSVFLNGLDFLDQHPIWKLMIIGILPVWYIVGLICIKKRDTQKEKLKRARYHVETRLRKRRGHRASFEAIRNEVNEDYSNDFLKKLIEENPEIFGTCRIKKGHKSGITLVEVESEKSQQDASADS